MAPIVLTGSDLTIEQVEAVARRGAGVVLEDQARARMQRSRDVVERLVADGEVVYGVTTGFGDLATTFIEPARTGRLQENLLMSHAAGVGAWLTVFDMSAGAADARVTLLPPVTVLHQSAVIAVMGSPAPDCVKSVLPLRAMLFETTPVAASRMLPVER